jgi:general secretion pathway protein C
MYMKLPGIWAPQLTTFLLAVFAAASMTYWGLKWSASAELPSTPVAMVDAVSGDSQASVRLLGGVSEVSMASASPSASSRFVLLGVLAGRGPGGSALISVDGKPAKPYRVGSRVADNLVLQSVLARQAVLVASDNASPPLMLQMRPQSR